MKALLFILSIFFSFSLYSQEIPVALKKAIKQDDVSKLKKILKDGEADVCYPTGKKAYNLLMLATKIQAVHVVKYLVKQTSDIDQICVDKTALMYAVESDNLELVKILIKAGADAKKQDSGRSAIDFAVALRHHEIKQYFNSMGIYKDYKLDGVDGPYIFDDWMYRVDQTGQIEKKKFDRTQPITVEVANKERDQFNIQLRADLEEEPSIYAMPERLLALSDIEGNFNGFYSFLVNNKVIDEQYNWTFGKGHLVLLGDFFDRGNNVTAVLWLIYDLEAKAAAAGGKVHFILGNHEVMNIQADIRYAKEKYIAIAQKISDKESVRAAYRQLYSDKSELGRWLRTKNVIEKIGDYLFVHAGLHPGILDYDLSIEKINKISRKYIDFDLYQHPSEDMTANFLAGSDGPLWFRGLAIDADKNEQVSLLQFQKMMNHYDAKKMVIGHTVVNDIHTNYEGKVIMIDLKHSNVKNSGKTKGLLVENGIDYKINDLAEKEQL